MELLSRKYTLELSAHAFPLGTDSMVLADFVRLPPRANVLDLGSGCGTLGLLLCAKDQTCHVTGLELSSDDHQAALENIRRNGLNHRLYSLCADIKNFPSQIIPGSFHCCVCNPPYFSGGALSQKHPTARRDDTFKPEDMFSAAAKALRYGGDFFVVQKPDRLAQLCHLASQSGLEPKELRLIRHSSGNAVTTIVLRCRKGGKPGLLLDELFLFHEDGTPSQDYQRIYHL